jgi:hypothetical protein
MLTIINELATYTLSLVACVLILFVTLGSIAEYKYATTAHTALMVKE